MTQHNVEQVIGRLVTDEQFRRRFSAGRHAVLQELIAAGFELNACELRALSAIDVERLDGFADSLDPMIQKIALLGGKPWNRP